jgi:hypothetical protein
MEHFVCAFRGCDRAFLFCGEGEIARTTALLLAGFVNDPFCAESVEAILFMYVGAGFGSSDAVDIESSTASVLDSSMLVSAPTPQSITLIAIPLPST